MNTYFIFYTQTQEVIALYQAAAVDLDRYIVHEGPQVAHALAQGNPDPRNCIIESDGQGNWIAIPNAG